MSTVTRWWWVRHAPVPDEGCVYGQRDLPADCSDLPSFEYVAARLPKGAVWITTHLCRTRQTAEAPIACGHAAPSLLVESDLVEQHFGVWQGQKREELFRRHSAWPNFWLAPADHCPPGGESFADLTRRVGPAILRLTEVHAGKDIVAVTHGGTIRAALGLALGLAPNAMLSFSVDNVSLTRIDHIRAPEGPGPREAWRVVTVNQRVHGQGPGGVAKGAFA